MRTSPHLHKSARSPQSAEGIVASRKRNSAAGGPVQPPAVVVSKGQIVKPLRREVIRLPITDARIISAVLNSQKVRGQIELEVRLAIVKLVNTITKAYPKISQRQLARALGVGASSLSVWRSLYATHGADALRPVYDAGGAPTKYRRVTRAPRNFGFLELTLAR